MAAKKSKKAIERVHVSVTPAMREKHIKAVMEDRELTKPEAQLWLIDYAIRRLMTLGRHEKAKAKA